MHIDVIASGQEEALPMALSSYPPHNAMMRELHAAPTEPIYHSNYFLQTRRPYRAMSHQQIDKKYIARQKPQVALVPSDLVFTGKREVVSTFAVIKSHSHLCFECSRLHRSNVFIEKRRGKQSAPEEPRELNCISSRN